jgi:phosphotransferase system HPr (HPr) family protein
MEFVDVANQFKSQVKVYREDSEPVEADGKSVMGLITLQATEGTMLRIVAEGEDAEQALAELIRLFENKFGEA